MDETPLRVYGTLWCGDCVRTRHFLRRHKVPFEFINIDADHAGEKLVQQVNHGLRSVPTIFFPDGSLLVEPSNAQLAEKLGIAAPPSSPAPNSG